MTPRAVRFRRRERRPRAPRCRNLRGRARTCQSIPQRASRTRRAPLSPEIEPSVEPDCLSAKISLEAQTVVRRCHSRATTSCGSQSLRDVARAGRLLVCEMLASMLRATRKRPAPSEARRNPSQKPAWRRRSRRHRRAYEDAGIQGLCEDGRRELANAAARRVRRERPRAPHLTRPSCTVTLRPAQPEAQVERRSCRSDWIPFAPDL